MKHGYGHGHADTTNNLKNSHDSVLLQVSVSDTTRVRHQDTLNPRSVRAS